MTFAHPAFSKEVTLDLTKCGIEFDQTTFRSFQVTEGDTIQFKLPELHPEPYAARWSTRLPSNDHHIKGGFDGKIRVIDPGKEKIEFFIASGVMSDKPAISVQLTIIPLPASSKTAKNAQIQKRKKEIDRLTVIKASDPSFPENIEKLRFIMLDDTYWQYRDYAAQRIRSLSNEITNWLAMNPSTYDYHILLGVGEAGVKDALPYLIANLDPNNLSVIDDIRRCSMISIAKLDEETGRNRKWEDWRNWRNWWNIRGKTLAASNRIRGTQKAKAPSTGKTNGAVSKEVVEEIIKETSKMKLPFYGEPVQDKLKTALRIIDRTDNYPNKSKARLEVLILLTEAIYDSHSHKKARLGVGSVRKWLSKEKLKISKRDDARLLACSMSEDLIFMSTPEAIQKVAKPSMRSITLLKPLVGKGDSKADLAYVRAAINYGEAVNDKPAIGNAEPYLVKALQLLEGLKSNANMNSLPQELIFQLGSVYKKRNLKSKMVALQKHAQFFGLKLIYHPNGGLQVN